MKQGKENRVNLKTLDSSNSIVSPGMFSKEEF